MNLLPEWAPNIHPIIVHFPIALLVTAVLIDGISLLFRSKPGIRNMAVTLFFLAALGALAAFFTGRAAGDEVLLPAAAQTLLTDHADWALRTTWFFGLFALLRIALIKFDRFKRVSESLPGALIAFTFGLSGLFLVVQTGDRGAQMVFEYGVGVKAALDDSFERHDQEPDHNSEISVADTSGQNHHSDETYVNVSKPEYFKDGSWSWQPGTGGRQVLHDQFKFVEGDIESLDFEEADSELTLTSAGGTFMFVTGDSLKSFQANLLVNIDRFDGTVSLVHHVQDEINYDFLSLGGTSEGCVFSNRCGIRQGRVTNGVLELFDEGEYKRTDSLDVRVVSDGKHFRGYVNDAMVVHGHADSPYPGPVGLQISGTGTIKLKYINVVSLR